MRSEQCELSWEIEWEKEEKALMIGRGIKSLSGLVGLTSLQIIRFWKQSSKVASLPLEAVGCAGSVHYLGVSY